MWNVAFYLILATFAVLLRFGTFIVYEGSQVILTQFGAIVSAPYSEPGIYFRLPFLQRTHYFDSRIQTWEGYQNYVPTRDRLYIGVETVAHWRIRDPALFLETLLTEKAAKERLESIIGGAVKDAVAGHGLVDTVRSTNNVLANRGQAEKINQADLTDGTSSEVEDSILSDLESVTVGRLHLSEKMLQNASTDAESLGIEIMNVFIKRITYNPAVERMVFERMISERHRVAERLRSIGRSESERIRGEMAEDTQDIIAPAVREAEILKGEADAKATRVYAESFGRDPEFYRFWRTLDAYQTALPERAQILGSLDSRFFRLLNQGENAATPSLEDARDENPLVIDRVPDQTDVDAATAALDLIAPEPAPPPAPASEPAP
ncbi:MAG: protease modulator HflC [Pseudomonadota bacterium]|jgi:membrane protease subunit HflC